MSFISYEIQKLEAQRIMVKTTGWVKKKYTRLMSLKKVTIALIQEIWLALIQEIWLGFDSQSLKLDHGMKNNHFGSLSIRLLTLKQLASFWKLAEIGYK